MESTPVFFFFRGSPDLPSLQNVPGRKVKILRIFRTLRVFSELRLMLDCVLGSLLNVTWCCFFWGDPSKSTRWCCVLGIYQLVGVVFLGIHQLVGFVFVSFFKDKPPMFCFSSGGEDETSIFLGEMNTFFLIEGGRMNPEFLVGTMTWHEISTISTSTNQPQLFNQPTGCNQSGHVVYHYAPFRDVCFRLAGATNLSWISPGGDILNLWCWGWICGGRVVWWNSKIFLTLANLLYRLIGVFPKNGGFPPKTFQNGHF